jgi:hypothetical protein
MSIARLQLTSYSLHGKRSNRLFPELSKKELEITTTVVDALGRDRRIVCCLGQNERALDGGLRVGARFSAV